MSARRPAGAMLQRRATVGVVLSYKRSATARRSYSGARGAGSSGAEFAGGKRRWRAGLGGGLCDSDGGPCPRGCVLGARRSGERVERWWLVVGSKTRKKLIIG